MTKISIDITSLLFIAVMLCYDPASTLVLVFCVLCHEAAHLLAAYLLRVNVARMRFDLFGARIDISNALASYRSEFIISAAGPAMNILLGGVGIVMCETLDGARMLSTLVSYFFGDRIACRTIEAASLFVIAFLWMISVFLWFSFGGNIYLLIFCLYLFYTVIIKRGY